MMLRPTRIPVALLTLGLLTGCTETGDTGPEYFEPIADAGENQVVSLSETVTLDGTASKSHYRFDELAYTWALEQIPVESQLDDAVFGTANGSSAAELANFPPDEVGTFVVSLTVFDGLAMSNIDLAVIEVVSENMPPVADCGDDQFGEVDERVHFDGSASRDPEGAQITYQWTLASAPEGSAIETSDIYDRLTATPSLVADAAGTYVLSLIVDDGLDYSEPCYVSTIIASENLAPIADAGESSVLSPCATELELNGNGSYDPDGDEVTYSWEVVSVPPGSAVTTEDNLNDPTAPNPLFTWDLIGEYTLSLQVFDGELYSARDLVTLVVQSPTANHAPSANAGDDQTVESESECTTHDYVFDCEPCAAQKFELDGTASSDRDGDELSYQWSDIDNELTYGGQYLAWTEAFTPPAEAEYGTAKTNAYEVTLTVADCEEIATDTVALTVLCTGELP